MIFNLNDYSARKDLEDDVRSATQSEPDVTHTIEGTPAQLMFLGLSSKTTVYGVRCLEVEETADSVVPTSPDRTQEPEGPAEEPAGEEINQDNNQ